MTGESLPVDKGAGDEVMSGTVNQFGAFEMCSTRVGEDSSIQRMVRLVQSADAGKAKIVGIADRWATWIVVIALTAAALTWLISGEIIRAVTILVVFCPCALVLATPTAIMAAIGNATHHGFPRARRRRFGAPCRRLPRGFDKTGTLTYGAPHVAAVVSALPELPREELYALAASAELLSEHPLGKAVVRGLRAETGREPPAPEDFSMLAGPWCARDGGGQARGRGQRAVAGGGGRRAPRAGRGERPRTQRQGMQPHITRRRRRLRGLHRPFRHAAPRRARHRAARARSRR